MFSFIRPFIFNLDPEKAHDLAIKSLKFNFLPSNLFSVQGEEILNTSLFGKEISNPIGLAAGFDKSAEVYNEIFKIGFGFVEIGTVTPKQQFGNEKPRVFRLEKDQGLINRLGFNNDGFEGIRKRIEANIPSSLLGIT
jgi:Dihydroorotate dehydrogenase